MRFYSWMTVGILTGCVCFGQTLSVGLIGGARASDDLTGAGATGVSKRYVIGPAVDIGLALGFGVEVDALYRREGYQTSFGSFAYNIFSGERANSWEFPMLLKYRIPFSFLEVGYAPRVIHGSISSDYMQLFLTSLPPAILIADGPNHLGSRCDGPFESGIRIFHDHDHPRRTPAERLGAEVEVFRRLVSDPEFGSAHR